MQKAKRQKAGGLGCRTVNIAGRGSLSQSLINSPDPAIGINSYQYEMHSSELCLNHIFASLFQARRAELELKLPTKLVESLKWKLIYLSL